MTATYEQKKIFTYNFSEIHRGMLPRNSVEIVSLELLGILPWILTGESPIFLFSWNSLFNISRHSSGNFPGYLSGTISVYYFSLLRNHPEIPGIFPHEFPGFFLFFKSGIVPPSFLPIVLHGLSSNFPRKYSGFFF